MLNIWSISRISGAFHLLKFYDCLFKKLIALDGWIIHWVFLSFINQAVLYEKPMFQGECIEIERDIYSFDMMEEPEMIEEPEKSTEEESPDGTSVMKRNSFGSVGSLKILGGLWVHFLWVVTQLLVLVLCFLRLVKSTNNIII